MAQRRKNIENIETAPKLASTVFNVGDWVEWAGAGEIQPLTPTTPVAGLCLEPIRSTDADYASIRQIHIDLAIESNDRFLMPVATGSAAASDIGLPFDVDAVEFGSLDVSAPGTQFTVTQVLSATLVEVKVSLFA